MPLPSSQSSQCARPAHAAHAHAAHVACAAHGKGQGDRRDIEIAEAEAAEAADAEEVFCLGWERWSEELAQAVASNRPWPMPPAMLADAPVAAVRVAEAAMNAVAAIWSTDVEYRRLLQHVEELQLQLQSMGKGDKDASSASQPSQPSLPLHEQQRLAKALLNEEQEVRRLREREKALSEQLAAARATARKLKDRDATYSATDLERQAALTTAKRQEATARQQYHDRESEIQTLRREVNDLSSQLAKKDAVQASLSNQVRQLNIQLQKARQQREDLTFDLRQYLTSMQDHFAADELRESAVTEVLKDKEIHPGSVASPSPSRAAKSPPRSVRSPRPARSPARALKQEHSKNSLAAKLLEFDRPESPARIPEDHSRPVRDRNLNGPATWRSRSPDPSSRSPSSPRYFEVTEADILGDWATDRSPSPARWTEAARPTKSKSPVRFTSQSPRSRGQGKISVNLQ